MIVEPSSKAYLFAGFLFGVAAVGSYLHLDPTIPSTALLFAGVAIGYTWGLPVPPKAAP